MYKPELVSAKLLRHAPWVLSVAMLLGIGLVLFTNSGPDDTHITYWPALTLLRSGRVTNYNGDPIEQSSSLAHVVLTALASRLSGSSVTTAGHLLAITSGVACLPVVYLLACRMTPRAKSAVPLFVATTAPFLHWTYGGLEAPIFGLSMLLVAWSSAEYLRRPSARGLGWAGLAMFFMMAARPEAVLVLACAVVALVVFATVRARRRGELLRSTLAAELRLLATVAVSAVAIFLVHFLIGRHIFPNPVRAKEHGLDLSGGLRYLALAVGWRWLWAALAIGLGMKIVAWRAPRISRARGATEQMVTLLAMAYLAFIATVGGDWMWGARMLAHAAPLLGLLVVLGATTVLRRRIRGPWLALLLVAGNILPILAIARGSRTGRPVWEVPKMRELVRDRYPTSTYDWPELASGVSIRDIPVTEELQGILRSLAPFVTTGPIVVASRQAGFTIFHALLQEHPPVRFIDLHNLVTDDFLSCGGSYLRRETHGALLPLKLLIHPPPELLRACPIVRPHVFFDTPRASEPETAENFGYTIVWMQRGHRGARDWTEGHSAIFIAVDSELASRAGLTPKTVDPLDYDRVTTSSMVRDLF
jgi:hypothetical protein